MRTILAALLLVSAVSAPAALSPSQAQSPPAAPLRLAIAGLVHGHVSGFLRAAQARTDVEIVGVFDADAALLEKYAAQFKLPESCCSAISPPCSIARSPRRSPRSPIPLDHPVVVEAAASRHVHVMMEKPLAVSNAHAQRIRRAAESGKIQVFVNYRDDLVSEPRRDLDPVQRAQGCRRDSEDGGHGRPQRPEGDQRAARVPRLAVGSRPERRRRAVRLRLLRRQPDDVDDGQPAADGRHRRHPAVSTRGLSARRRRSDDPRRVSDRPGHHPGVMELAVSTARISKSTANTAGRSPPAATACASGCRSNRSRP